MEIRLNNKSKVLFINPFGIGDVLFTTPLVGAVRSLAPEARLGFLCNRRAYPVLEHNADLNDIWVLERDEFRALWRDSKTSFLGKAWGLYRTIRSRSYSIAFDLSLSNQFGFFLWTMGVPHRLGFRYRNRGKFLNASLPLSGYAGRHVAEHQLDLLGLLEHGQPPRRGLKYRGPAQARSAVSAKLQALGVVGRESLVAVAPGGGDSWGPNASLKQWNPGYFAALCRKLSAAGHRILLLGAASDQVVTEEIAKDLKGRAISLAGQCSLAESAAVMAQCVFVITNDGGLLHLAVAQDIPTVSFFGPTDDAVYGPFPRQKKHLVLSHSPECRPCYRNFRMPPCSYDKKCLEELSPDEAMEKIQAWMRQGVPA